VGGLTTKIHTVIDAVGLLVRLPLTPGQASDKTALPSLIAGLRPVREAIADRGYSAIELSPRGTTAHIPSQNNARTVHGVDFDRYRRRNLIDRFFNKFKHLRRIAACYDKLARNFLVAVTPAAIRIHIRHYESTT
jgi:transposase